MGSQHLTFIFFKAVITFCLSPFISSEENNNIFLYYFLIYLDINFSQLHLFKFKSLFFEESNTGIDYFRIIEDTSILGDFLQGFVYT